MSENAREFTVPLLIERQDRQLKEIRDEMSALTSATHENALSIKDLVVVLSESSSESRRTREDVQKLEASFLEYKKASNEEIDELKTSINEKKSNQKLIIVIGGAILSGFFAITGWIYGKG